MHRVTSSDWIVDRDQFRPIGKRRLHLHLAKHFGYAADNLLASQNLAATGHDIGDGLALSSSFQNEVANERDTLRIVELYATCQPSARHQRSHRDEELVSLTRRKVHAPLSA